MQNYLKNLNNITSNDQWLKASSILDEIEALEDQTEVLRARECPNAFCEYVMRDAQTHEKFKQADIHEEIQNAITNHNRLLIMISRDHGKTSQLIGRVLFELGGNTDLRVKFLSATDSVANKRILALRTHIEINKELHKVFPHLKKSKYDWGKTSFTVQRKMVDPEPSCEGSGILSTGTGGRVDLLIVDDPVDEKNAILNPALREQVKSSFYNAWSNLCTPESKIIVLCTPWHENDLTHELKDNNAYKHLEFKIDDNYTPIWPERWPKEKLIEREEEITERPFAKGFKLIAISEGEQIFKNIINCKDYVLDIADVKNNFNWECVIGIDLAISKRKGSAYTVLTIVRNNEKGHRHICDIIRGKFNSITTALLIIAYNNMYAPEIVLCENNAYQQSILEWVGLLNELIEMGESLDIIYKRTKNEINGLWWENLQEFITPEKIVNAGLPLMPYTTGAAIADEQLGLPNFAAEIDGGLWTIPFKDHKEHNCKCNICVWINEMRMYPVGKFKDTVMSSFFCQRAFKRSMPRITMI